MNAASKPQNTNFYANITQTSEKRKTCFGVFYSECRIYSRFTANEHKRARNAKLVLAFFTASAAYIRGLPQMNTNERETQNLF